MGRKRQLGRTNRFSSFVREAKGIARVHYYPSAKNPIYVEFTKDGHMIHVGYENGEYFVVSSLQGQPLYSKYNLTKSQALAVTRQALAGRDIGEELQRRAA